MSERLQKALADAKEQESWPIGLGNVAYQNGFKYEMGMADEDFLPGQMLARVKGHRVGWKKWKPGFSPLDQDKPDGYVLQKVTQGTFFWATVIVPVIPVKGEVLAKHKED